MFCTSCGTKNSADANFCKECGQRLSRETARISEEAFERALPDEEQVSALLERAYRLRRAGDMAAAIALCEEALQLRQTSTSAHSLLGQLYESQGERDKAIQQYEYVLQLNPGSIADRVKLDALKDGSVPSERRPHGEATSAPIVLTGHSEADPVGRTLAVVGGVAALLLLGGIFALQLRSHGEPARPGTAPVPSPVNSLAQNPVTQNTVSSAPPAAAPKTPSNVTASQAAFNLPANSASERPLHTPTAPPITVQVPQPQIRYVYASAPVNGLKTARPASTPATPETAGAGADGKVRLNPDDDVAVTKDGQVTIPVRADKKPGSAGSSAAGDKGGKDPGQIKVEVTHPRTQGGGNPASRESRDLLTMGNDLKKRGDWMGAIKAYRNALGQSGDDAGYLYQQIGFCFQKSGDKNSALTNYERAISEYQKQSNTDAAQDGIRACQTGIRACN